MKILILLLLLTAAIFASVGEISSIKGSGTVTRASSDIDATIGLKLEEKDILKTKEDAKLQIIFKDGTIVTVGKSSTFDIAAYVYDKAKSDNSKVDFGFLEGSFKSVTGQIGKIAPDKFNLKTKTATIGIRGTTIVGNQESVACTQGTITISSNGVTQIVPAGMFSRTPPNAPPTPPQPYVAGSIGDVEDTPAPGKKEKEKKEEDKKSDKAEKSSTTGEKSDKQGSAPNSKEEAPANSPAQSNAAPSKQESSSNGTPNVQPQASAATNGGASPNIDSRSLSNIDTPLPGLNNSAIPEQTVIQPNVHNIVPNVQNIISDIQKIVTVVQTVVDTEVKVVAETETIAVVVTPPVVTPPVVTPPVVTPPVVTPPVVTPPVVTPPVVTPPVVTPPVVTGPTAAELQAIADALAAANAIAPIVSTTITSSSSLDAIANTTGLTKVQTSSGNDYLEYGHWDSVAINGETCVITPRFSYISGVVTSSDYVNQMIANANIYTPTATYIGEISSIVTNNGIPTVSGGDVTLVFDFFHKNFAGTLIVNEGNFKSVITGDVHKYGFDSMSVTKATDSAANITSGNLNGQFYGTTAQAAGGKFNLNSSNAGSVSGVFGAAKVVPIP